MTAKKSGWLSIAEEHDPTTVHVIPVDDHVEHDDAGDECVCGPRTQYLENGGKVVTHGSLDGRELSEPDYVEE